MNFLSGLNVKKIIVFICVLGCFFFITYQIVVSRARFFERASSFMVYPVLILYHTFFDPLKKSLLSIKDTEKLQQMLYVAQDERDQVVAENIMLRATQVYEKETEEVRLFKKRYNNAFSYTAQVLSRHFSDHAHYFLIQGGEGDGIKVDMVAVYQNCLIGRVIAVYPWYSKVQLITDRSCKIAAMCAQTAAHGIHEGINQETTVLRYVSHLSAIMIGDLILSSGQGLIFPKGFGLGRVVSSKINGLHHEIMVQSLLNLHTVMYCVIVSNSDV